MAFSAKFRSLKNMIQFQIEREIPLFYKLVRIVFSQRFFHWSKHHLTYSKVDLLVDVILVLSDACGIFHNMKLIVTGIRS